MIKKEPYYAVIFTSSHSEETKGYIAMAQQMEFLAKQQAGFLGMDSARNTVGITVSYWKSLESIKAWKHQTEHVLAQQKGQKEWYDWYHVRVCKVEHEYDFRKKKI